MESDSDRMTFQKIMSWIHKGMLMERLSYMMDTRRWSVQWCCAVWKKMISCLLASMLASLTSSIHRYRWINRFILVLLWLVLGFNLDSLPRDSTRGVRVLLRYVVVSVVLCILKLADTQSLLISGFLALLHYSNVLVSSLLLKKTRTGTEVHVICIERKQ